LCTNWNKAPFSKTGEVIPPMEKKLEIVFWKQTPEEESTKYLAQYSVSSDYTYFSRLKNIFASWLLSGTGFDSKNKQEILIFSKIYSSEQEWKKFIESSEIEEIANLKEIK